MDVESWRLQFSNGALAHALLDLGIALQDVGAACIAVAWSGSNRRSYRLRARCTVISAPGFSRLVEGVSDASASTTASRSRSNSAICASTSSNRASNRSILACAFRGVVHQDRSSTRSDDDAGCGAMGCNRSHQAWPEQLRSDWLDRRARR
jgi:hypothetical protein